MEEKFNLYKFIRRNLLCVFGVHIGAAKTIADIYWCYDCSKQVYRNKKQADKLDELNGQGKE